MDAVEEIKSRLDVADVIGEYLQLKPAGSGAFKALCPFHQEKTPSFYVSRTRQSWHCFGCDQGGDFISFVMRLEGMEFPEALEFLAQKAGIVLPKFEGEKSTERKRIHEVNDLVVRFFRAMLETHPDAEIARTYLKRRGVDDLTADLFQFGYALPAWSALHDALIKKGVGADEMIKAGLVIKRDNGSGVFDRFRGRLMFPIADVHGRIVGFTARILTDEKGEAKYINTPETSAYRKSAVLYGLDKAKGEIRQKDLAILVEGNMDVVASHQFGVGNVVAASGTALTGEQLSLLRRFTTNIAIAFDQDAAGGAATLRGLDLARAEDFTIRVITLPPEAGKDPDEAVRKNPELWREAIKQATSIMEWIYHRAFRDRKLDSPEDKKKIAADILPEVRRIVDPVERDHWLKRLGRDLGVGESALVEALNRLNKSSSFQAGPARTENRAAASSSTITRQPEREREKMTFATTIARPQMLLAARRLGLSSVLFEEKDLAALYEKLEAGYPSDESLSTSAGLNPSEVIRPPVGLAPDETMGYEAIAFFAERTFADWDQTHLERELEKQIKTLFDAQKKRNRERLQHAMKEAHAQGDTALEQALSKEFEQWK